MFFNLKYVFVLWNFYTLFTFCEKILQKFLHLWKLQQFHFVPLFAPHLVYTYKAYDKHPSESVSKKVIIIFLSIILHLNNFIFNCSHYLQIMGCAMGTICAPAYNNVFTVQAKHIYLYIHGKALLFLRYIDNIFMIWNGTIEELILFIDEPNKKHKTIKFDYKISTKQIEFLDTMVYRDH